MYKYFIAYAHEYGFGRAEITRDTFIQGIDDIEGIENSISEHNGLQGVTIINFQLFNA